MKPLLLLGAVVLSVASSSCRTGNDEHTLESETAFSDAELICERVEAVLDSSDEGFRRHELPAVAEWIVFTRGRSKQIERCGDALFDWLAQDLAQRPIDLRPRLETRILALGRFLLDGAHWRERALRLFSALLLDERAPLVHYREDVVHLGPGSHVMSRGWSPIVSPDDLERWLAFSLQRHNAERVYLLGRQWGWGADQGYSDLLIDYFAARYTAKREVSLPLDGATLVFGRSSRPSPPPPVEHLGLGDTPADLVWFDLVAAFRETATDPRWRKLPPALHERLIAAVATTACP